MDLPTKENTSFWAAAVLVVSHLVKPVGFFLMRKQKREAQEAARAASLQKTHEDLLLRFSERVETGFAEMRAMFHSQNLDIRELRIRTDEMKSRQDRMESKLDAVFKSRG